MSLHKCNLRQRDFVPLQKDILQSIYSGIVLKYIKIKGYETNEKKQIIVIRITNK